MSYTVTGLAGVSTWQDRCRAVGGVPTVFPPGTGPRGILGEQLPGYPACRIGVPPNATYYDPLSSAERDAYMTAIRNEQRDALKGKLVDPLLKVAEATGLDEGITGLGAKVLGIPKWVLLSVLGVAAYAYGVQAGVFPKLGSDR